MRNYFYYGLILLIFLHDWCAGWDLNPHARKHTPLKRTCLPIPPPARAKPLYKTPYQISSKTLTGHLRHCHKCAVIIYAKVIFCAPVRYARSIYLPPGKSRLMITKEAGQRRYQARNYFRGYNVWSGDSKANKAWLPS